MDASTLETRNEQALARFESLRDRIVADFEALEEGCPPVDPSPTGPPAVLCAPSGNAPTRSFRGSGEPVSVIAL
jgi:hypothetical protein